jgi:membrane-bound lytic murein transglycosylase F
MQKNGNFKGSLDKVTAGMKFLQAGFRLQARIYRWVAARISRREALLVGIAGLLLLNIGTCSPPVDTMRQIRESGQLRVVTLNSPTTYYIASYGPTGFEYDLAQAFAQQLGVKLELVIANDYQEMIEAVRQGRAHMAAGLTITESRRERVRFGPALMQTTPELVYQVGRPKPESLAALDVPVHVATDSSELERLEKTAKSLPNLKISVAEETNSEGLLYQVAEGEIPFAVADSRLVAANSRYYPQLRVALELDEPDIVAWAFARKGSDELFQLAERFVLELHNNGELKELEDKHFGYDGRGSYVGGQIFARQAESRLPEYREIFEKAAAEHQLDWRMLAAIGYQESHWNPHAVSPTGVRGLMMLTEATASFMKVNRLDPAQSIHGGAGYLRFIDTRIPASVPEPDRTWMTLAAYNQGWGSLLDARNITLKWGGNPDRWSDVRKSLLMLTQPKWYRQTKYGYARGYEAVAYVSNVRAYYDILVWLTSGENLPPPEEVTGEDADEPPSEALEIETPVL